MPAEAVRFQMQVHCPTQWYISSPPQHHNLVPEDPKHLYFPQDVILEQYIDSILDGLN
jgi:hypothetical protein